MSHCDCPQLSLEVGGTVGHVASQPEEYNNNTVVKLFKLSKRGITQVNRANIFNHNAYLNTNKLCLHTLLCLNTGAPKKPLIFHYKQKWIINSKLLCVHSEQMLN